VNPETLALLRLLILTASFAFGLVLVMYEQLATPRGWLTDPAIRGNSPIRLIGVFTVFMAPALAFNYLPIAYAIVTFAAGLVLALALLLGFKRYSQYLAAAGLVVTVLFFLFVLI
jgi:hypothetical protein